MSERKASIEFIKTLYQAFTNQMHKPRVTIKLHHQDARHLSVIMTALKDKEPESLTGGYGHDQY